MGAPNHAWPRGWAVQRAPHAPCLRWGPPAHARCLPCLRPATPQVVVANVGDSRAVLSRGGRALDLSTEHRVWGKTPTVLSEIERIEAVGGWVDDGRVCGVLAVSRWGPGGSAACCCRTALQQSSC